MNRIHRLAAIAVAFAAAVSVTALAAAKPAEHTSSVQVRGATFVDPDILVYGSVSSAVKKCVANRKVTLYFAQSSGPFTKVDTDRTSAKGTWAGKGLPDMTGRVKAVVAKSSYGPKGDRSTCAAATSAVFHIL